ncbi:MAG: hypothetical protein CVU39_21105 [Chloroflexi bacterium HGW-Chloroflexi-10]|nr:MAG: hypothetical protein CVU39_21105 [Chloroflexi bacterium HGW-Chloroflexi-10]
MNRNPKTLYAINTLNEKELIEAFNLSPRLAKRIMALRPYTSPEQLDQVWGIDFATKQKILDYYELSKPGEPKPDLPETEVTEPEPHVELIKNQEESITPPDSKESDPQPIEQQQGVLPKPKPAISWKTIALLIVILIVAAVFRFSGLNWDGGFHQHPDERYMTMVAEQIRGVDGIRAYFDTQNSTLNPLNFGSYTYGMLPLFLTRMVAEWVNMASYDSITLVGRFLSGLFDLTSILALYLLAARLYNKKVALLASALAAAAVLPIQLSHFFTVDSFSTLFVILSVHFLLWALPLDRSAENVTKTNLLYFGLFGFTSGLAGACKVNTLPVLGMIFIAAILYLAIKRKQPRFWFSFKLILLGLFFAVLFAFLAFRIFQPYAFAGPSFFDLKINERWYDVLKEVTNQVAGNSEWPPNHHWTNRPVQYAWVNMVLWGMGLPLGLMAWLGWGWAGYRIWKGEWGKHLFPFIFILGYFLWQNMQFWRYMRYFLPIYPFLIMFAAWALIEIITRIQPRLSRIRAIGKDIQLQKKEIRLNWQGLLGLLVLLVVLLGTYSYAFAFTRIYTRPHSRVDASRWILQNIPGPMNAVVESDGESLMYPIPVYNNNVLKNDQREIVDLKIKASGTLSGITAPQIKRPGGIFNFQLTRDELGEDRIADGWIALPDQDVTEPFEINFTQVKLEPGQTYFLQYQVDSSNTIEFSKFKLGVESDENPLMYLDVNFSQQESDLTTGKTMFQVDQTSQIDYLEIVDLVQKFEPSSAVLKVSILIDRDEQNPLAQAEQRIDFLSPDARYSADLSFPQVALNTNQNYQVMYELIEGSAILLYAENYTLETSWDDALPLSVDNINALGDIYDPLNMELYEPDTPEKREKMLDILDSSEYIVIPSNRAYDSMPRLEMRYPLTLKYYQLLFDCDCSGNAMEKRAYSLEPPFKSPLGFDLVAVFTSNPNIGLIQINDQNADESFTVYDHPKVFVFKKSADFSIENLKEELYQVDLDSVVFQKPIDYTRVPTALRLTSDRLEAQRNGGTWSSMFNRLSILNRIQPLSVIAWYLLLLIFGLTVLPSVFLVFPGLPDKGYPLIRMAGLLMLAWIPWFFGSIKWFAFTRFTILGAFAILLIFNGFLFYKNRQSIIDYFKSNWRHIVFVEVLFLLIFLFSLVIRLNNPDLWNPWLGGEKPMDFTFFNGVLKSVYFPPPNPWFSEHYINYYYYGFVVAAIPTKVLGIMPSIAYNLILPSWFAMTGVGVFAIGYNIYAAFGNKKDDLRLLENGAGQAVEGRFSRIKKQKFIAYLCGVFALMAILFFGNFYQVKTLWNYLPEVSNLSGNNFYGTQLDRFLSGASQVLSGEAELPGDGGRWYFSASRPILHDGPDTPIVEFPYFSFLYADMHPHLLTMPFYALGYAWCLGVYLVPLIRRKVVDQILALVFSGLCIGSFLASHTWDFPVFIALGSLTIFWMAYTAQTVKINQKIKIFLIYTAAFVLMGFLFYFPFIYWFKTEYNSMELWKGVRTPLADYFTVFGLSLFIMISLLLSSLYSDFKRVYQRFFAQKSWKTILIAAVIILVWVGMILLWFYDYQVLAFGLPLVILWVYALIFKKGLPQIERFSFLLFSIGYLITFFAEVFVLKGDVGRSNMVFRTYIAAWFLVGFASSLALVQVFRLINNWRFLARISWIVTLQVLILFALSYPLTATNRKMQDRWPGIENPLKTLDGALFMLGNSADDPDMPGAIYSDEGRDLDLGADYFGIKYMQDHIIGTPVIVEGHTTEYRWGGRYAIYTGLPSVIGWNWHTRQHNVLAGEGIVEKRIQQVNDFYNSTNIDDAHIFLNRYQVKYIVVSGLEHAYYSPEGLAKFSQMVQEGDLSIAYTDQNGKETTIYEVLVR